MIVVRKSPIAGNGGFAERIIKKGECLGEYTGEIISDEEADERYGEAEMTYLFSCDNGFCIDATNDPNPLKYINHSCNPNCEAINDNGKIFYYALRDIAMDEEITVDYELIADKDEDCPCFCQSVNCRKTMKQISSS